MTDWTRHLTPLDAGGHGWTCRGRVEQLLAGERVLDATALTERDVCDDGHVHTDVTLGLRTPTRLLHVIAGDAQHVTDEHELGLQCTVTAIPLRAISEVAVASWDGDGQLVAEIRVARAGGSWQAIGDIHDCGDPHCDIPPGSIRLDGRPEGIVLLAAGADADDLVRFGAALSMVAGG